MCIRNEYRGASSQKYALNATCERKYKQNDERNQAKFGIVQREKAQKRNICYVFARRPTNFCSQEFSCEETQEEFSHFLLFATTLHILCTNNLNAFLKFGDSSI